MKDQQQQSRYLSIYNPFCWYPRYEHSRSGNWPTIDNRPEKRDALASRWLCAQGILWPGVLGVTSF